MIFPPWAFYLFGVALVIVALADTAYVTVLFARGHVEKMWPVKLLVAMVEALVTTTFSTVFGWVLFPFACLTKAGAEKAR